MTATTVQPAPDTTPSRRALPLVVRRNAWALGLYLALAVLLVLSVVVHPTFGSFELEILSQIALPIAFAAAAQTVVVIGGGIDLSVGAMMALTNVTAAALMETASPGSSVLIAVFVLLLGLGLGLVNGTLIVITRVPDIVVTLAMLYVWGGAALLVLGRPGGAAADWLRDLVQDGLVTDFLPRALVVLLVGVGIVWLPLRRSRLGLAIFAVGSDRLSAFRSGVNVDRTKIASYAVCGLLSAMGGLSLTATSGIGTPTVGIYTLAGIAAMVLGGVSLAGGRGGMLGPIAAVFLLALVQLDLIFLGVDPSLTTIVQGLIMVLVVLVAGFATLRRTR